MDNQPSNSVARWNGSNWETLGSRILSNVYALTSYKGQLIAGGSFQPVGDHELNSIAGWDGEEWRALDSGMANASGSSTGSVRALTIYKEDLVAGGTFGWAGDIKMLNIAAWNGENWHPVDHGMNGRTHVLGDYNGDLIAGGSFTAVGGVSANRIARWNGRNWASLGSGVSGGGQIEGQDCTDVRAATVYQGDLIVGGNFKSAGGVVADKIARWDGESWHSFGKEIGGESHCNTFVDALTVFRGELIAGGVFHSIGGTAIMGIARWDGVNWRPLGRGINGHALTLANYGGELIAGGSFTSAGDVMVNHIARWDGTLWHPLGSGMSGGISIVRALTIYGGELIAGGDFFSAGGVRASNIARWDGTTWYSFNNPFGFKVVSLQVFNGAPVSGGVNHLALWDGANWLPLIDKYSASVYALAAYGPDLIVGGEILETRTSLPYYWARWRPSGVRGDADEDGSVGLPDVPAWPDCLTGPLPPDAQAESLSDCLCIFNTDGDSDADLRDLASFQNDFGG